MAALLAICGECHEPVDAATVYAHMEGHGVFRPDQWNLAAWPDGVSVVIDPDEVDANHP